MKEILVKLYKSKSTITENSFQELKIQNNNIKFMKEVLLENSNFFIDKNGNWLLSFFVGKNYEQNLFVTFNNNQILNYNEFDYLSSMAMVIDENGFNERLAEKLSLSIRNSKAIKISDFKEYPSHFEHIDGRGISFFSRINDQEYNFQRQIILYALAYAYLSAIESISNQLAKNINNNNSNIIELNQLYIEATKFNSTFLFHQPVLVKNASLVESWKYIDSTLEINISANELLEQLSNVHYILNLDADNKRRIEEQKKQDKQEKWNFAFAIIGILIAIIQIFA